MLVRLVNQGAYAESDVYSTACPCEEAKAAGLEERTTRVRHDNDTLIS